MPVVIMWYLKHKHYVTLKCLILYSSRHCRHTPHHNSLKQYNLLQILYKRYRLLYEYIIYYMCHFVVPLNVTYMTPGLASQPSWYKRYRNCCCVTFHLSQQATNVTPKYPIFVFFKCHVLHRIFSPAIRLCISE